MKDEQRIEEAHGLWELAVVRLAAFVECGADKKRIQQASKDERAAFENWRSVSGQCGA